MTAITIACAIHGPRVWTRVGVRQHVCRDGRVVRLAVWESPCMVCGQAFEVSTPRNVITHERSRAFSKVTCPRPRLTAAEASRLSAAARVRVLRKSTSVANSASRGTRRALIKIRTGFTRRQRAGGPPSPSCRRTIP